AWPVGRRCRRNRGPDKSALRSAHLGGFRMLDIALRVSIAFITAALVLNFVRMLRGPSAVDRVLALDTLYINSIALLVLVGILRASALEFEAAVLIAMMGFVGTVALCKFLLRGDIVE